MDRRFIEDSFPVKEVSKESSREKNRIYGNISTLHVWWARRPLTSSITTNYASLIPSTNDQIEFKKIKKFIIKMASQESKENTIKKARDNIISQFKKPPKVLDPFSGGGSIPLESLRLGCDTYGNDYNPVAVLIEKCTLEYPQIYGEKLLKDIKIWADWVFNQTINEIGDFYPEEITKETGYFGDSENKFIPIGYIWARTIHCQNPSCGIEIPLMGQFWLSKKSNKKIALYPYLKNGKISFKIVGEGYQKFPSDFDPSKGTVSRAVVECPICKSTIDPKNTKIQFQNKKTSQRIVAVVLKQKGVRGKHYRTASSEDMEIYYEAEKVLEQKVTNLYAEWGIFPIPNEPTPKGKGRGAERAFTIQNYGLNQWGDLFNSRQKLVLITFINNIRKARIKMIEDGYDEDYSRAIVTYLSFVVSKTADFNSTLSRWANHMEKSVATFGRQALSILWDYVESNQFGDSFGSWEVLYKWVVNSLSNCINIKKPATISQCSATKLIYPDDYFDAIFTDPPYYDNVPYSYLSDFFYVWLKRGLGDLYPNLFATPLTPKTNELVVYTENKSWDEAKDSFESMLKSSFREFFRVLKPGGIATIVYAHKTTEGWETVINALLNSGLTVTGSWPISTERSGRMRSRNSAALASSVYIIARKFQKKDIGWYSDVKKEIKDYIPKKLDKLWEESKEDIVGADFFLAAIGSSIEVFGKYNKIMDFEGNEIKANTLLNFVRDVVSDYAMKQILHNGISGELSPLTKFYLLWRWNYNEAKVPFDEARKLAQSAGIDLSKEWNKGFIVKSGQFITVLGPDKRDNNDLKDPKELIDTLQSVCLLFKQGKKDEMNKILEKTGWINKESFFKVAQAISETLPKSSSETKIIQQFLAGKDKIMKDLKEEEQSKLV